MKTLTLFGRGGQLQARKQTARISWYHTIVMYLYSISCGWLQVRPPMSQGGRRAQFGVPQPLVEGHNRLRTTRGPVCLTRPLFAVHALQHVCCEEQVSSQDCFHAHPLQHRCRHEAVAFLWQAVMLAGTHGTAVLSGLGWGSLLLLLSGLGWAVCCCCFGSWGSLVWSG